MPPSAFANRWTGMPVYNGVVRTRFIPHSGKPNSVTQPPANTRQPQRTCAMPFSEPGRSVFAIGTNIPQLFCWRVVAHTDRSWHAVKTITALMQCQAGRLLDVASLHPALQQPPPPQPPDAPYAQPERTVTAGHDRPNGNNSVFATQPADGHADKLSHNRTEPGPDAWFRTMP